MILETNRFETLPLNPDGIPGELKAIPRWLLWRLEDRAGKPTKTPYQVSGALAKVNDPATWSDFDTILTAYLRSGWSGIGIVLTEDDDLVGVDLDKVLDPDTGELAPEASRIVADLPTYCEVSPSGRGLRLFGFGKLPQGGRRKGHVEMYEAGRYLTVTGNQFNGHGSLAEITPQLTQVHARIFGAGAGADSNPVDAKPAATPPTLDDADLLDKARRARNGADFERLWAGDTSGHGGDESAADLALCNALAFWASNDAARIDRLFRQSGLMRPKWDKVHHSDGRTYGQATIAKAIDGSRETYTGKPGATQARPAEGHRAEAGSATLDLDAYRGTDDANAALLLGVHGANIRYCPPWEKWLIWTGSHWRIDDALDIDRLAADIPRLLYRRAADAMDSSERRKIADLARKLERTALRTTMLIAARHHVVVHHKDLDKGHFLLNCRNGTVDLTTGAIRPHERKDLLTHDVDIEYRPDATAPTWLRFLNDVFAGDVDLIRFVQRAVGYSLTGSVKEQVLLICHGSGSNGKSVFLNILRQLLGKLAWQAVPDLLLADRNRRHPTEQADLFGKRLVVCQETGEGRRFNETLVKQLTGGDAITARRMHEDNWSFDPTHKLWLSTNHRPEIKGTDYAIWRRPRLIPFTVTFHDSGEGEPVKDPDMEARLIKELPGILNWAICGCLDWQRHGLGLAEAVKVATSAYQAEMDVLAGWIADCCVIHRNAKARASALYRSYSEWCEQSGEHPEPQRRWGMRLPERGFHRYSNDGIWYRGIGLRTEGTEGTEPEKTDSPRENNRAQKYAKSSSVGSVGSVNPPDDGLAPPQPVDTTPSRNAPLPPTASSDAGELWAILKHYRGWETFSQLAKKLGWPQSRVIAAAQELQGFGRASISGAMVKPVGEVAV